MFKKKNKLDLMTISLPLMKSLFKEDDMSTKNLPTNASLCEVSFSVAPRAFCRNSQGEPRKIETQKAKRNIY